MVVTFRKKRKYNSMCVICKKYMKYEQGVRLLPKEQMGGIVIFACDNCLEEISNACRLAYSKHKFTDDEA